MAFTILCHVFADKKKPRNRARRNRGERNGGLTAAAMQIRIHDVGKQACEGRDGDEHRRERHGQQTQQPHDLNFLRVSACWSVRIEMA